MNNSNIIYCLDNIHLFKKSQFGRPPNMQCVINRLLLNLEINIWINASEIVLLAIIMVEILFISIFVEHLVISIPHIGLNIRIFVGIGIFGISDSSELILIGSRVYSTLIITAYILFTIVFVDTWVFEFILIEVHITGNIIYTGIEFSVDFIFFVFVLLGHISARIRIIHELVNIKIIIQQIIVLFVLLNLWLLMAKYILLFLYWSLFTDIVIIIIVIAVIVINITIVIDFRHFQHLLLFLVKCVFLSILLTTFVLIKSVKLNNTFQIWMIKYSLTSDPYFRIILQHIFYQLDPIRPTIRYNLLYILFRISR